MVRWVRLLAVVLGVVLLGTACASESGHHRRRHRRHRHRPPRTVVIHEAPAVPRTRILRRVCAPVASCGRFVGCGLAEEEPDPDAPGQVRYRVKRYDTDPSRVDTVFEWGRLCWSEQGGRSCVDAFETGARCPGGLGALPSEVPPRCEAQAGVCGPVGPDAGAGAVPPDGGPPETPAGATE